MQILNRDRSAGTGSVVRTLCQSEVSSNLTASLHSAIHPRHAPRAGVSQLSTAAARKGHRPLTLLPLPDPCTCCCIALSTRLAAPRVLESSNNHCSSRCGALGVSFILCAARLGCLRESFRESIAPMATAPGSLAPGSPAQGEDEEVPLSITRSKTEAS